MQRPGKILIKLQQGVSKMTTNYIETDNTIKFNQTEETKGLFSLVNEYHNLCDIENNFLNKVLEFRPIFEKLKNEIQTKISNQAMNISNYFKDFTIDIENKNEISMIKKNKPTISKEQIELDIKYVMDTALNELKELYPDAVFEKIEVDE